MENLTLDNISSLLKKRLLNSHKGNFGHALFIAGSTNKIGAAIIVSKACLRSGVGLVTVSIPKKERSSLFIAIPEVMIVFRKEKTDFSTYNAIAIGPGLGINEDSMKLVKSVLENTIQPIVLDADALNMLSSNQSCLSKLPKTQF